MSGRGLPILIVISLVLLRVGLSNQKMANDLRSDMESRGQRVLPLQPIDRSQSPSRTPTASDQALSQYAPPIPWTSYAAALGCAAVVLTAVCYPSRRRDS